MFSLTSHYEGLESFEGFDNYNLKPHNTCGQAVLASVLKYAGIIPTGLDPKSAEFDAQLLERVYREHGPNWPVRNAITNRSIMLRGLKAYGVPFREEISRPFTSAANAKKRLLDAIAGRGHPVIVLLDLHKLRLGPLFSLHWAVAYRVAEDTVAVSSWGKRYDIPWDDFLQSWKIWFLAPPYRYYMIEICS